MPVKILVDRSIIVQATTAVENIRVLPPEKPDDWNFPTFFTNPRLERSWREIRRNDWVEDEKMALSEIAEKVASRSVELYSSIELHAERMRVEKAVSQRRRNALDSLQISDVKVPFDRSKLPLSMDEFSSKASLIKFCKTFLLHPSAEETEDFISRMSNNPVYGPDEFEIGCLRNKAKFQSPCKSLYEGHIPDAFHLWTAEENSMHYFLTLDKKFINAGRCCRTLTSEDSHRESMPLDVPHEQAITRPLPHDELVQLQRVAAQAGGAADLGRQGDDLARAA